MNVWLDAALRLAGAGKPAVLVTVAGAEGSTPRESGARMIVSADGQWDTIGGGHLEWRALELARGLLQEEQASACATHWISLGPSLAQCCGGAVTLLFECLSAADTVWLMDLRNALAAGQPCLRERVLGHAPTKPRAQGGPWLDAGPVRLVPGIAGMRAPRGEAGVLVNAAGNLLVREWLARATMHVVLFGAGHVGQAVVRLLGALPCRVTWVDERDAQFPESVPDNVSIEATDLPEAVIDASPADAFYLVMTHSHALDEQLCRHILRRNQFGYLGLIGSRTKRVKFERRLLQRGIPPESLARMTCPIGVAGIHDKAPASIAVAVAAQLLQVREHAQQSDTIVRDEEPARQRGEAARREVQATQAPASCAAESRAKGPQALAVADEPNMRPDIGADDNGPSSPPASRLPITSGES